MINWITSLYKILFKIKFLFLSYLKKMNNTYNRSIIFTPNQNQPQTNLTPTLRPINNAAIPISYQKSTYIPVNRVRFDSDYLCRSPK